MALMGLVVECMCISSNAERNAFKWCIDSCLSVWKLESRFNANQNLPLHFTAEVNVVVHSAWLQPDAPHSYSSVSPWLEVAALVQ